MNYNVKPIESPEPGRDWYEVVETDNEYHLWIVEHDLKLDKLDCTCEAGWCSHRAIVAEDALTAAYREDQADAIARQHGQY